MSRVSCKECSCFKNVQCFQESDSAHSYCGHPLTMDLSDQVDLFIVTIICSTDLFSSQYQCHNSHPEPFSINATPSHLPHQHHRLLLIFAIHLNPDHQEKEGAGLMIGHGAIMNICRLAFRDLFALDDVFFLERINLVINIFFQGETWRAGEEVHCGARLQTCRLETFAFLLISSTKNTFFNQILHFPIL